jgi:hypothetical protein
MLRKKVSKKRILGVESHAKKIYKINGVPTGTVSKVTGLVQA